jgi:transcription elongation factor GreA
MDVLSYITLYNIHMLTPPRRRWTKSQMIDTGPIHLTPEGIKRLQDRLARLKKDLPAFIEETQRTAAYGDRSDSAEYKEAKSNLRRTNRQIITVEDQLKRVVEIPSGRNTSGRVQLGCTVTLEVTDAKNKKTRKIFRILGSAETDPGKGRISHNSPLGAALLEKAQSDIVVVQTPNGPQEYQIMKIS